MYEYYAKPKYISLVLKRVSINQCSEYMLHYQNISLNSTAYYVVAFMKCVRK